MKHRQAGWLVPGCVAILIGGGAFAQPPAIVAPAGKDWALDITAEAGLSSGHVTYQIGGLTRQGDIVEQTRFPVSELKWPLEVVMATLAAEFTPLKSWQGHLSFAANLTDDAGKMEDSDWELPEDATVLTTFSRSDAKLTAWMMDLGLRYWIWPRVMNSWKRSGHSSRCTGSRSAWTAPRRT